MLCDTHPRVLYLRIILAILNFKSQEFHALDLHCLNNQFGLCHSIKASVYVHYASVCVHLCHEVMFLDG